MGMAASQARFLSLTARKSNVEYEGQQINQERTSLANESSNLFTELTKLDPPTPPTTADYYKPIYTFNSSEISGTSAQYTLNAINKTPEGTYANVTHYEDTFQTVSQKVHATISGTNNVEPVTDDRTGLTVVKSGFSINIGNGNYDICLETAESNQTTLSYLADSEEGQNAYLYAPGEDGQNYLCYYELNNQKYYLTTDQLAGLHVENTNDTEKNAYVKAIKNISTPITQDITVIDYQTNETGRTSSITLELPDFEGNMQNYEFELTCTNVQDEEGYKQAMNDYEYYQAQYEKAVADINAKTEIIQEKDKSLELELKQLDTEQSAIKTEMDAVQKVVDDNVEATFKTFG